jgi:hypothetical protein
MAKVPRFKEAFAGRWPIVEMDNRDSNFILDLRFFNSLLVSLSQVAAVFA